jgi:hypothetical protein
MSIVLTVFVCMSADKLQGCPGFYMLLISNKSTAASVKPKVSTADLVSSLTVDVNPKRRKSIAELQYEADVTGAGDTRPLARKSDDDDGSNLHVLSPLTAQQGFSDSDNSGEFKLKRDGGASSVASTVFRRIIERFRNYASGNECESTSSELKAMERGVAFLTVALVGICVALIVACESYKTVLSAYGDVVDTHGTMIRAAEMSAGALQSGGSINDRLR